MSFHHHHHHPPLSNSISSPVMMHSSSISSPPSPHHHHHHQQLQDTGVKSSRRSSICTPSSDSSTNTFVCSSGTTQHRRSRSFRDCVGVGSSGNRYTAFEIESEIEKRAAAAGVKQKRSRNRPPPLQWSNVASGGSSSVCSSASTSTSVFFNTSTESNKSYHGRVGGGGGVGEAVHGGSNWSMCSSEYSTTSTVNKGRENNNNMNSSGGGGGGAGGSFPKGKLAYLASRRGSSGSVCSTTSTPPNTPGYSRFGAISNRRQSSGNFLEVPPSSSSISNTTTTESTTTSPATTPTNYTPRSRSRVNSLPASSLFSQTNLLSPTYPYIHHDATPNPRNDEDYLYRLRTFNITASGSVVNCGDTFVRKSKSNNCITSEQQGDSTSPRKCSLSTSPTRSQRSSPCHRRGSLSPRLVVNYPLLDASCCVSRDESDDGDGADEREDLLDNHGGGGGGSAEDIGVGQVERDSSSSSNKRYRVVLLGDAGVGKSALVRQFMTSEYINTYDMSLDDEYGEREVSILLDSKESSLVFVDHPSVEMSVENSLATYEPHACIIVYSITDKHSFEFATDVLRYLWQERTTHERSIILCGNKCDLARSRVISSEDGKNLASCHETKFIETSSGIQHNVDELLVGVLKQIRLREAKSDGSPQATTSAAAAATQQPQLTTASTNHVHHHQNRKDKNSRTGAHTPRGSIMGLLFTRELINKLCFLSNKAKSCENLHVL